MTVVEDLRARISKAEVGTAFDIVDDNNTFYVRFVELLGTLVYVVGEGKYDTNMKVFNTSTSESNEYALLFHLSNDEEDWENYKVVDTKEF